MDFKTLKQLWTTAADVFSVISKAGPRALRLLLGFSTILFVTSIALYYCQYTSLQRAFERLLASPSLPVAGTRPDDPQRFPALEAVLTSHLDAQLLADRGKLAVSSKLDAIFED